MLSKQRVFRPEAAFDGSVYPAVYPSLRLGVPMRPGEDMSVDFRDLVERADPIGHDPVGVGSEARCAIASRARRLKSPSNSDT